MPQAWIGMTTWRGQQRTTMRRQGAPLSRLPRVAAKLRRLPAAGTTGAQLLVFQSEICSAPGCCQQFLVSFSPRVLPTLEGKLPLSPISPAAGRCSAPHPPPRRCAGH